MQSVVHVVSDLTKLRYLIPLSRKLNQFVPDIEQTFAYRPTTMKYNRLLYGNNMELCRALIAKHCGYSHETFEMSGRFDVVFQVETDNFFDCQKRVSLGHGFDYAFVTQELRKQADVYVCSLDEIVWDAEARGIRAVRSPVPVCMWDSRDLERVPGTAFVFYPDNGDEDIAAHAVDELLKLGLSVFVKQRRKHQPIRCGGIHVYDDVWYPSEAVVIPLVTDVVVGFGSSAYVDLVPMGVTYINVDVHSNETPWDTFVHPSAPNYKRVFDVNQFDDVIKSLDFHDTSMRTYIDDEQLREFVLKTMIG